MPKVDEGGFVMDYFTPPGTSLDESNRRMAQVDALLRANPEVETFSRRLGTGLGGDLGQSYHGDYFVRLKPDHSMPAEQAMNAVAEDVAQKVPGVEVEVAQLMEDLIGDLTRRMGANANAMMLRPSELASELVRLSKLEKENA